MKKVLALFAILFCLKASSQTIVYDTTVVRTPLTVAVKSGAGQRDSLYMPAATTAVNGYMTAVAMTNLANLQTSMATANNNIATLQSQVAALGSNPTTNVVGTTTYTLQSTDNKKLIIMTTAATITLPTGLPDGWTCTILQGSTSCTFTAAVGVTWRRYSNQTHTSLQWNATTITVSAGNVIYTYGNMKA